MANETVFRDKSIERISSPDQLNDYVRLSDPGIWLILAAVTMILAGVCVFGVFGHINSTVPGVGIVKNGKMICLVKKEYSDRFTGDMKVKIDDGEYGVSLKSDKPVTVWDTLDDYSLYIGNMQPGEWVYELDVDGDFADGTYEAWLITEKISPVSFLFGSSNEKQ